MIFEEWPGAVSAGCSANQDIIDGNHVQGIPQTLAGVYATYCFSYEDGGGEIALSDPGTHGVAPMVMTQWAEIHDVGSDITVNSFVSPVGPYPSPGYAADAVFTVNSVTDSSAGGPYYRTCSFSYVVRF